MLLLLLACLDHTPIPGGDGSSFVAMQADFSAYLSWEAIPVALADTGHVAGDRTVYINNLPSDDDDVFPVGTMIVKTIEWEGGTDLHAMVKRGGGFNPDGAAGWEWFELVESESGAPVIRWRGSEPPEPGSYGFDEAETGETVSGDCNVCHGAFSSNDYVHSVALGG